MAGHRGRDLGGAQAAGRHAAETIEQIRGLTKVFGLILAKDSYARFEASARAQFAARTELGLVIGRLLARALDDWVAARERQPLRARARSGRTTSMAAEDRADASFRRGGSAAGSRCASASLEATCLS
jgi:hypothetical protein